MNKKKRNVYICLEILKQGEEWKMREKKIKRIKKLMEEIMLTNWRVKALVHCYMSFNDSFFSFSSSFFRISMMQLKLSSSYVLTNTHIPFSILTPIPVSVKALCVELKRKRCSNKTETKVKSCWCKEEIDRVKKTHRFKVIFYTPAPSISF